ncbi:MAG: BTAD domain-containing putative transcriptional regulator [Pseudonocardiaceae bacterium]
MTRDYVLAMFSPCLQDSHGFQIHYVPSGGFMRFDILGPIQVRLGDRRLWLGGRKQRSALAVLLVQANHVVSVERLIDELWGEAPPSTAKAQIHRYISVLRQALGSAPPHGTRQVILTRPPGYILRIESGQLDLCQFDQLVRHARESGEAGDLLVAANAWTAALALWRGPALGGATGNLVEAEAARLGELRMAAVEERIDVELALGRHTELVGEVTALVLEQPLRDRLRGQLMLALYRSGRRADALAVYRDGLRVLVEELGLDPGPELRRLEREILCADPALQLTGKIEPRRSTMSTSSKAPTPGSLPLIRVKLASPAPRRLVLRAALVKRLTNGPRRKLTLVCAPAGSGKSAMLADWYTHENRPFAWLYLDHADNDSTLFWTYLIEALRTVAPQLGNTGLELLRTPGIDLIEVILPGLINELMMFPDCVVLVLDNYHLIENNKIQEQLAFLLIHLPTNLEIVIATRCEPLLPLAQLRAYSELLEINAAELRFSVQEAHELINEVVGRELQKVEIDRLWQQTEGWAAGLYLTALTLQAQTDPLRIAEGFDGDRHILDYLAAEVLDKQPGTLRDFLLQTSILGRLCGSLCDAVTGTSGSAQMLYTIERSNLFLVPLDHQGWYRYHRLFSKLLHLQLRSRQPERVPTLHRRAAAWYLRAGWVAEAIGHTIAGGDLIEAKKQTG